MTPLIERVARAIWPLCWDDAFIARCERVWADFEPDRERAREMARAAIEACFSWPKHEASMHLTHNDHLGVYRTVQQAIDDEDHGYRADDWVSEEQKQKAIVTNECWTLQWYPDTPVGFCLLSAADLPALLDAALKGEG